MSFQIGSKVGCTQCTLPKTNVMLNANANEMTGRCGPQPVPLHRPRRQSVYILIQHLLPFVYRSGFRPTGLRSARPACIPEPVTPPLVSVRNIRQTFRPRPADRGNRITALPAGPASGVQPIRLSGIFFVSVGFSLNNHCTRAAFRPRKHLFPAKEAASKGSSLPGPAAFRHLPSKQPVRFFRLRFYPGVSRRCPSFPQP